MAYACVVLFVGSVVFGYIIGNVSSILSVEDDAGKRIRTKIKKINSYMNYRRLPMSLQLKIRRHYEYVWKMRTIYDEHNILLNLPTALRCRVAISLHRDFILSIPFFQHLQADCLSLLLIELKSFIIPENTFLFLQGMAANEMFFIIEGQMEVVGKRGQTLAVLSRGAYFGEWSILSTEPTKRSAAVKSISQAELFSLSKESFDSVVKEYPELRDEIKLRAFQRVRKFRFILVQMKKFIDKCRKLSHTSSILEYWSVL